MNKTSGVTYDDIMMEKLLQEEYADVEPSVNPGANEVYAYLFEAEQSYLEIMKALALEELKQTAFSQRGIWHEANDGQQQLTQNAVTNTTNNNQKTAKTTESKGFIARAIDAVIGFIKKIWQGIVGVWKWLVAKFDKYIRFNDSFVKKYSVELAGIQTVKFDGYSFSGLEKMKDIGNMEITVSVKHSIGTLEDEQKRFLKQFGLNENNLKPTVEDFKTLYFGSTTTSEQEFTISKQLEYIAKVADGKVYATKIMNKVKGWFTKYEAECKNFKNKLETSDVDVQDSIAYGKWVAPIAYMAITQYSKALVARANQARAICIKALQDKESKQQESTIAFTLNTKTISEMLFEA